MFQNFKNLFDKVKQESLSEVDIIEEEIKLRDKTDSTREIAPLKKAVDAFKIDVSTLTIDQVFNKILQKIKSQ